MSIETAIATIIASTTERSDARVRGTGQIVILSAVLSGAVSLYLLTLLAGERGIALDELRSKILAPMVRRGFVRVNRDESVVATPALAAHADPFGAWMAGDKLVSGRAKSITAEQLRPGDVIDTGARMIAVHEVRPSFSGLIYAGPLSLGRTDRIRVYRAA